MGKQGVAGRPASPKRYQAFLLACAIVTREDMLEESGVKLAGMGMAGAPPAPAASKKHSSARPGR